MQEFYIQLQEVTGSLFLATFILFIPILVMGFYGAPLWLWTIFLAIPTLLAPKSVQLVFLVWAIIYNIPFLRAQLISRWIMHLFRIMKFVPHISETEKTALDAGAVWAEGELFSGKPDFKKLMNEPYPKLTKEEQDFINGPVEKLCEMADDWQAWEKRDLPPEVWDFIKKERFFGMIIPKEFGGLGFTAMAHSEVLAKVSSRSLSLCTTLMVPNSLGPAELLVHYGTEEQKKYLLPRLARGEELPCFALTEPGAGSDAGSIQADGILFKGTDGKLYLRLNWNKRYITLAAISTILGLAFRLKDPENILGKGPDVGITCVLIPSKTPGIVLGRRHDPLGVPFYNCPTQGKDVVVSVDHIVGGIAGAGRGWKMLMECLGAGRGISLPAQAAGIAKLVTRVTSCHATIRKQFGVNIGKFEGIEEPLARIAGFTYLLEAMRKYTLGALDQGIKPAVVTAIVKYHSTELERKIVNDGMDIMAGNGISQGPRNLIASYYIAAPISITVEGANILTRTLIIFGQGALRAHPYAYKEVLALEKNDLYAFDKALWGHVGHVIRNAFRCIMLSWSRGWLAPSLGAGRVGKYYRRLSWCSASFALLADIAMGSLGGSLKVREKITGRFADILSWMYIATAILRRFKAEGSRKEDLPFVHFTMNHSLYEIQKAFNGIFNNLKVPGLDWIFRGIIRPWSDLNSVAGETFDAHTHKIATLILADTEQRARISEGIYIPKDLNQQMARLEHAFRIVKRSESIEEKVRSAVKKGTLPKAKGAALFQSALDKGVVTKDEFQTVKDAEITRYEAIQVDDFSQEEYLNRSSRGVDYASKNSLRPLASV
ncbi:MAG: acyl-CoA dehydrogenase [Pseudomonadota bacterium]|nr:acyl-CoA dehydrogenase [Pseudomonadota bacterium]